MAQDGDSKIILAIKQHRPALLVIASQILAATLNAAAKYCETRPRPIHPFLILHIRMLVTGLGCLRVLLTIDSPPSVAFFGSREVRGYIILRAVSGIVSAGGFFFSMLYLTLSETTALAFLGPLGSLILAKYLSLGTIQWVDLASALGAFIGIILIIQPQSPFQSMDIATDSSAMITDHLYGLICGALGACGGMVVLMSIRQIGTRAHPMTSINAFAWAVVVATGVALAWKGDLIWPDSVFIWACLIYVGISGFFMEYLVTLGLSEDKTSVATLMIYTLMIWSLIIDFVFFQVEMTTWVVIGTGMIIGSLSFVTISGSAGGGKGNKDSFSEEHYGEEMVHLDSEVA
ncbi:hypothetical protein GGR57DRAFT_517611 [Xylariaceae sp. FL1272]|nr:hypothetical protein GGR57DRAFT_517611 [Xylariaceae sp. FL1272]